MTTRFTTDTLLTSVKSKARLVSGSLQITDADILEMATEEMLGWLVPEILRCNAGYFIAFSDQAIVSNQSDYPIPARSIGNKIAGVYAVNGSGAVTKIPVATYDEDAVRLNITSAVFVSNCYIRNNVVVLAPIPQGAPTVRIVYYQRPSDLITTAHACEITGTTGTTQVTVVSNPDTLDTSDKVDIISGSPPFPFLGIDQVVSSYDSGTTTFTLTAAFPSGTAGMAPPQYLCAAGQSPIPQIPYELHPTLVERTTSRVLAALGDVQGAALTMARAEQMQDMALKLITPRAQETNHKIVNTSGPRYTWQSGRFWPWPIG